MDEHNGSKNFMETRKFRKFFCKLHNIPMTVFNDLFYDELILLDGQYNSVELYSNFISSIEGYQLETFKQVLDAYQDFKESIVSSIKNNEKYQDFKELDKNKYKVNQYNISSNDIYRESNVGKVFFSIDLVKANFQSMKFFNTSLVNRHENYEKYIKDFKYYEIFKNSRYTRQVAFGMCNVKNQVKLEKYMISLFLEELKNYISLSDFKFYSNDELIFELTTDVKSIYIDILLSILHIMRKYNIDCHIEIFELQKVRINDKVGYIKYNLENDEVRFKCLQPKYIAPVIEYFNKGVVSENSIKFEEDGELLRFADIPTIEIGEKKYVKRFSNS